MKQFKTIVFDLGGVLIDWNPDYVFKTIFQDPVEMKWFYDNICTPDWNEQQDAGRPLSEGTEWLVKKFPEHEKNIRAFYGRWEEMLGGSIPGTVEILKELKQNTGFQLLALTNWSAETFPIALNKFDFLHWFDGRIVSGEEKTRKPFREFYELMINRYQLDPSATVFIDDNARNLVPALDLGMQAIHFKSPQQFREDLNTLGIL